MALNFLIFDYSEDEHGHGCFEAMATVSGERIDAVRAEVAQVLDWARQFAPDACAPLEEGGEWDYQLDEAEETAESGRWRSITLTLSGSAQFCRALEAQFLNED